MVDAIPMHPRSRGKRKRPDLAAGSHGDTTKFTGRSTENGLIKSLGRRRKKVQVECDWCHDKFWTSQPEKARYCPGTNHRTYAWRERQRGDVLEVPAGMPVNDKKVTTRVVTK
jgi:hypothetical protein